MANVAGIISKGKPTMKGELFLRDYATDLNVTRAARAQGVGLKSAWRLLQLESAQAFLQAILAERIEKVEARAEDVLRETMRIAFFDPLPAFSENNAILDITQMPEDVRRVIHSIDVQEKTITIGDQTVVIGVLKKVRFHSKLQALELVARVLGMLKDARLEIENKGNVLIQVNTGIAEPMGAKVIQHPSAPQLPARSA